MFARLTGTIDTVHTNTVILDVGGVGYLVACSSRTLSRLGQPGSVARLHIETQVREDAINLFGFFDAEEQSWFKLLTTVQGVGARVAMNILSACEPGQLHMAIGAQDRAVLTQADGVGPKLATRIVTELKDKVPEFSLGHVAPLPLNGRAGAKPATEAARADADAVSALINLGYGRAEAFAAVMRAKSALEQNNEPVQNASDLIRLSLKELGQS
jgi:holliday junction DNA helicase RuvA